ncbi:ABC transporter substrate-binding protein [Kitasatospora paracochleata]|uniref:Polar amino acid transport system substrate-binding protein n=1 Tax=Kitasatospora paracochleata TaxID=58354 RepID=A0ABT1IVJ9_9ACTN|nr:ABC transporter substrate-binding protein [Kitasatospora paracochleata]MCP2308926.1 polar amino acid transport system substrate-binding protein [Kitasatospora paracochleata]
MARSTGRVRTAVTAAVTGTLLLSACSAVGGSKEKLHDQLPDAIRKAGVIKVGGSFTAAPVIFRNPDGKADGLDPDLAAALEKVLGVRLDFQDVGPFANVLPGLMDKKYDIAMSGITDTREREQGVDKDGKQVNDGVDFVDYFMAGIGTVVRKGNPAKVSQIDDLCGHGVAVKKGTTHDDLATRQVKACEHVGKTMKLIEADTDNAALDAVRAGQADAYITDYPKALYNAQTVDGGRTFDIAGQQLQPRPFGIALRKSDRQLRDVLTRAVNTLVTDGTYDQILSKRQLTVGAIQNSVVNGSS